MKTLILFLFFLSQISYAEVYILADEKQWLNFTAEVEADNSKKNFSEFQLKQDQSKIPIESLISKFEYAQYNYFTNNIEAAKSAFEEILTKYKDLILTEEGMDIVSSSYLKRASLETSHDRQIYWLQKSLEYNPYFDVNKLTIDKSIADKWEYLKQKTPTVKLNIPSAFKPYSFLVINSKVFSIKENPKIIWPKSLVRFKLYSDIHKPVSGQTSTDLLSKYELKPEPLVLGSCENYKLQTALATEENYALYFSPQCIAKQNTQIPAIAKNDLQPKDTMAESSPFLTTMKTNLEPQKLVKNKWFWVGLLGAGIIYYNEKNKDKSNGDYMIAP